MAVSAFSACLLAILAGSVLGKDQLDEEFYAVEWQGTCLSGKMQTPIDLPWDAAAQPPVPDELITHFSFPVVKNPVITSVGTAKQIKWDPAVDIDMSDDSQFPMVAAGGNKIADVLLDPTVEVDRMVKMIPIQFHWHAVSEHAIGGYFMAAELHIVTLIGPGEAPEWGCDAVWEGGDPVLENCTAVFGIMYQLTEDEVSPVMTELVEESPTIFGEEKPFSIDPLDLMMLLPDDLSYYSYVGSLTTPACNEGLRWHVFKKPMYVTSYIMEMISYTLANTETADGAVTQDYRFNNRLVQPLNNRTVWFHDTGFAYYDRGFSTGGAGCYGDE